MRTLTSIRPPVDHGTNWEYTCLIWTECVPECSELPSTLHSCQDYKTEPTLPDRKYFNSILLIHKSCLPILFSLNDLSWNAIFLDKLDSILKRACSYNRTIWSNILNYISYFLLSVLYYVLLLLTRIVSLTLLGFRKGKFREHFKHASGNLLFTITINHRAVYLLN